VHKSVKMWVVRHVQMGGASLSKAVWVWLSSHAHLVGAWMACHAPIAGVGLLGLAKVFATNDSWVTQGLDETDSSRASFYRSTSSRSSSKIILLSLE